MFTLKIENVYGQTFELTHNTSNYKVVGVSGLTYPTSNINTSEGIMDGAYYNSQRLQMRNIVIDIMLDGNVEANRQQLYKIFPIKSKCTIYFQNENRNVKIDGWIEVVGGDLFSQQEQIQVSIICPQPYFEGLTAIQEELSRIVKLFEFPFSIQDPIPISEIQALPFCTIQNGGDMKCGCILEISILGDVKGLRIYNTTTQEMFGIDYDFQAGDIIMIDTTTRNKKCIVKRNNAEINLLFYRAVGSKWFQLVSGANDFTFRVSEGQEFVKILFTVVERFGGV